MYGLSDAGVSLVMTSVAKRDILILFSVLF